MKKTTIVMPEVDLPGLARWSTWTKRWLATPKLKQR
jgi:hypothetical protein